MDEHIYSPKISIVTVSFNAATTIEQTIESVIKQNYRNIEYVIIDGGSQDGTVSIINKYQDKIAYFVSEPDNGIYDAMNKAVEKATGDYIFFLGTDDCLLSSDIIGNVANYLTKNPDIDVLSGQVWLIDEEYCLQRTFKNNNFSKEDIYTGQHIHHQGVFVRTHIMKQEKFDTYYQIAADYDFLLKCYFSNKYKFKSIDLFIAFASNSGISAVAQESVSEYIALLKKYNLSQERIDRETNPRKLNFFKRVHRKLKRNIDLFLKSIGCLKYIKAKTSKNWVIHKCEWKHCRWCKDE